MALRGFTKRLFARRQVLASAVDPVLRSREKTRPVAEALESRTYLASAAVYQYGNGYDGAFFGAWAWYSAGESTRGTNGDVYKGQYINSATRALRLNNVPPHETASIVVKALGFGNFQGQPGTMHVGRRVDIPAPTYGAYRLPGDVASINFSSSSLSLDATPTITPVPLGEFAHSDNYLYFAFRRPAFPASGATSPAGASMMCTW